MIEIDGSAGERGGQVARTSLTLAMSTASPIRIRNIRARRSAPSQILLRGGTHNPRAPTFEFIQHAYLPLLTRLGYKAEISLERADHRVTRCRPDHPTRSRPLLASPPERSFVRSPQGCRTSPGDLDACAYEVFGARQLQRRVECS